ncbi:ester cyclase [Robiginitalea sp. SC105]|uniref:ester cyclase n=1 Tax=Robiginitalea sp. SC105 TaxID=2762332 RepID=UPI00163A636B|nr:ester cyclase [Robiginitalea sp. SC105]MBC2838616.1 ester cyclase [Robiginitalea sp. SC105]
MKCKPYYLFIFMLFIGCHNQDKSSEGKDFRLSLEESNDKLLNQGNIAFADSLFASDYNNMGPDAVKDFVTNLRTAFPDLEVSVENKVQNGKMQAWIRTHKGTHRAPFMGYLPLNNAITWQSTIISERDDAGMISGEWGNSDLAEQLEKASANGVYTYLPPVEGHAIINMDQFIWSYTNTDTKRQFSEYGDIEFKDGLLLYTVKHSNWPERIGTSFKTRMLGQFGDTVKWNFLDADEKITGLGQALKASQ